MSVKTKALLIEDIIKILKTYKSTLTNDYAVQELAIFGSYARNEQKHDSDIDIMVTFQEGYSTFDNYMELNFFLTDLFAIKVDLITKKSIRQELKKYLLEEAVYV